MSDEEKACTKCGFPKPLRDFSKRSASTDGLDFACRECKHKFAIAYGKTIRGMAVRRWQSLIRRIGKKQYEDIRVTCSQDEFIAWAIPAIVEFLAEHPNGNPSVDRIDPDGHYELGNMRIIDRGDNLARSRYFTNALGVNMNSDKKSKLQAIAKITFWSCKNVGLEFADAVHFMKKAISQENFGVRC